MFFRIVAKAMTHRRSRIAVALIALAVGASVAAAMLSVYYDAGRKMSRELRAYGANVMVSPSAGAQFIDQRIADDLTGQTWPAEIAGAAPYLYVVATAGHTPDSTLDQALATPLTRVVVAGTWIDAARKVSPWWQISGQWVQSRNDDTHCLVGARLANQLGLRTGQQVTLIYGERPEASGARSGEPPGQRPEKSPPKGGTTNPSRGSNFEITGILTTGGSEEDQIVLPLAAAQKLAGLDGRVSALAISAVGDTSQIEGLVSQINTRVPGVQAEAVRQISEGEGRVLGKLSLTMLLVTILMLAAASLSVTTTLGSLVMERRKEIGTMKAIGAKDSRLLKLFLFEVVTLGVGGGVIGYVAGIGLAQVIGHSLFGLGVTPRLQVFGVVMAISIAVALASGIIPIRKIKGVQPAVILRGD
jgi:putative ABC transport system permease protein